MANHGKFETPLLRVSRPVSACQRCRNAKVKCDGKLPACTACERAGKAADCSSANDQFARGKERSYVASLENRIEKLERQIAQAKARKATANAFDMVTAQPLLAPPVLVPDGSGSDRKVGARAGKIGRKETQDVNDLVSDFGFLSVNATARDFNGFTKQMSSARLVLSTSSKEEMPDFAVNELPQRHVAISLAKHYLENIHVIYPLLSEAKLFAAIDALYQDRSRFATPADHWMTRMVLAIACASKSRKRGDVQYQDAVRHAAGAIEHIESVMHPGSVSGIQAMLVLVLYAILDPHHFSSWYLIGIASRAMVDIGMHQEPPRDARLKEADLQIRRHVYASIYALDRSISMVHRRGYSFTDDSTGIIGPLFLSGQPSPGGQPLFSYRLDTAIQVNQLRQMQSSTYQTLFQSDRPNFEGAWPLVSGTIHDMHRWWEALPESLSDQQMKQVGRLFHSEVSYSSILFLSPDLKGILHDYGKFLVFEYAIEYADTMALMIGADNPFTLLTDNDFLGASYVGDRLIHLLNTDSAIIFNNPIPLPPMTSIPQGGPLVIPARTVGERVNRAYRCLSQLEKILAHLGARYSNFHHLDTFKARASSTRHLLQNTYDRWNRSLGVSRALYVSSAPLESWT
ncbi:hypothetical protein ACLMJK_004179 [Lecanora helva]